MNSGKGISETDAMYAVMAALSPGGTHPGAIELLPGSPIRYRLLQFVDTGTYRDVTITVGTQMFTTGKVEAVLRPGPTFDAVTEIYRFVNPDAVVPGNQPDPEELEWERQQNKQALRDWPLPVRTVAMSIAEEIAVQATEILRNTPDWPETRCAVCAGTGHQRMACACVFFGPAGVTDLDQQPETNPGRFPPDPDCTECSGTGNIDGDCLACSRTGGRPAPIATVVTIGGGETLTIHASPGGLATRTPVTVNLDWEPNRVTATWTLSEQPLAADAADRASIDLASALTRCGKSINNLPPWLSGTTRQLITPDAGVEVDQTAPEWWREQLSDAHHVASVIADELQAATSRLLPSPELPSRIAHAAAAGIQLDQRHVVTGRRTSVGPLPATADLLTAVIAAATESGHTAALTTGYSSTEECGPQVVLLDENLAIATVFEPHFRVDYALVEALDGM